MQQLMIFRISIDSSKNIFIMEKAQGVQMDSSKFVEEWKKAGLTEDDFTAFVEDYVRVYCEQLFSLPKKGKKVVLGGYHVTLLPDEAKEHADSIMVGNAGGIINELIKDYFYTELINKGFEFSRR